MKKLLFATVSVAALAVSGAALSADLPYKARPVPAPIAAPVPWTWTGFYIGGHFGAGWGTKEWNFNRESFSDAEGHTFTESFDLPSSFNVNGFLGGGQLGYRFQAGPWVFGIQGSFTGADIHGRSLCAQQFVCQSKIDWLATVTGQIGWAVDRALIYFTGGAAWVHDKSSINFTSLNRCVDGEGCDFNKSQTRVGGLIGAGVSYALTPSWSAFIEYNFMDFGKHAVDFTFATPNIICLQCTQLTRFSFDIDQHVHVIKAGINWRFDWAGWGKAAAPVVARY